MDRWLIFSYTTTVIPAFAGIQKAKIGVEGTSINYHINLSNLDFILQLVGISILFAIA